MSTTTGPYIFYRAENEDSRAQYLVEVGLVAEDTDTWVDFFSYDRRLLNQVKRHLDWGNRKPTPFISAYCDEDVAGREAERLVRVGKTIVRFYKIDMRKSDERREYQNV